MEETKVGRSWKASELRLKSFEDLQKLWFILVKERNMLLTYRYHCRRTNQIMQGEDRLSKVQLSMSRLKAVIGERTREWKAVVDPVWTQKKKEKREHKLRITRSIRLNHARNRSTKRVHQAPLPKHFANHPQRKRFLFKGLKPRTTPQKADPAGEAVEAEVV